MKLKQFFKLDLKKIVIFVILFIISTFIPNRHIIYLFIFPDYGVYVFGTPFGFFYIQPVVELAPKIYFDFMGFIGNLIFWYFLSCLIVWIYYKVKKK